MINNFYASIKEAFRTRNKFFTKEKEIVSNLNNRSCLNLPQLLKLTNNRAMQIKWATASSESLRMIKNSDSSLYLHWFPVLRYIFEEKTTWNFRVKYSWGRFIKEWKTKSQYLPLQKWELSKLCSKLRNTIQWALH